MDADRVRVMGAAKRLRHKKRQERFLRKGTHPCDTLESGQVISVERLLYALRREQVDLDWMKRKYSGYRKRLLGR